MIFAFFIHVSVRYNQEIKAYFWDTDRKSKQSASLLTPSLRCLAFLYWASDSFLCRAFFGNRLILSSSSMLICKSCQREVCIEVRFFLKFIPILQVHYHSCFLWIFALRFTPFPPPHKFWTFLHFYSMELTENWDKQRVSSFFLYNYFWMSFITYYETFGNLPSIAQRVCQSVIHASFLFSQGDILNHINKILEERGNKQIDFLQQNHLLYLTYVSDENCA